MNKYYIYVGIALAILIVGLFVFRAELSTSSKPAPSVKASSSSGKGFFSSKPAPSVKASVSPAMSSRLPSGSFNTSDLVFQNADKKLNVLYTTLQNTDRRSQNNKASIDAIGRGVVGHAQRLAKLESGIVSRKELKGFVSRKEVEGAVGMLNRADRNAIARIDAIGRGQETLRKELQRRGIVPATR